MSGHYVGELVWIPNTDDVWKAAEVSKVEGDKIVVKCDDDEAITLDDKTTFLARTKDEYTGGGSAVLDDLTQLVHLHEASVLNSLQHAFDLDQIYTFTGPILIAINPFKKIDGLYDKDTMTTYVKSEEMSRKPHVFSTASSAFRAMRAKRKSQTVLISGESGAGKTETTKYVMKLTTSAGSAGPGGKEDVEKGILSSNPILEAFGNAKTLRNNNSSRFGKFIELEFEDKDNGPLCGSCLETYLLEKVRVIDQQEGERNYHVFYQACAASQVDKGKRGASSGSLSLKGFDAHSKFTYLTHSTCWQLNGVDDVEEFNEVNTALKTIGISDEELESLWNVISAVLNVGNLKFADKDGNTEESCVAPASKDTLSLCAELLSVNAEVLENAFCKRTIKTGKDVMVANVKTDLAADARDALARQLYGSLFDRVVVRVNESIGTKGADDMAKIFIGVLDIFGFECFKVNSFEQLCINFTNERLQQYFNTFVFKLEQQLYESEGIPWNPLDFPDNQDALDLLQGKPNGIFTMLDEECKVPKGSDKNFCSKLWKTLEGNKRFGIIKTKPDWFVVKHFAGPVEYLSDHFLEKNKDALRDDLVECCYASTCPMVSILFQELKDKLDGNDAPAPGAKSAGTKKAAATISAKFKTQLTSLMTSIEKTEPHFVRCIKPNPQNKPDHYDRKGVTEQLRYQGVLQVVQLTRSGYPVRNAVDDCWLNYKLLLPEKSKELSGLEPVERAKKMMDALTAKYEIPQTEAGAPGVAVGKTMVFFRQNAFEKLHFTVVKIQSEAAIQIQKIVKGRCARKKFDMMKNCIIAMQAGARGYLGRNIARTKRLQKKSAIVVQKHFRGMKGRQAARALQQHRSAVKLQAAWRGRFDRQTWVKLKKGVNTVQERFRVKAAQEQLKRLRTEAKEVGNLVSKAQMQGEEIQSLRKEKELLQSKALQLDSSKEEVEKLNKKNQELDNENQELKKKVQELEAMVETLKSQPAPAAAGRASIVGGRRGSDMKGLGTAPLSAPLAFQQAKERQNAGGGGDDMTGSRAMEAKLQWEKMRAERKSFVSSRLSRVGGGDHRNVDVQLVGAAGVGKTAMLESLFDEHDPSAAKQLRSSRNLLMVHYRIPWLTVGSEVLQDVKLLDCSGEERATRLVTQWFNNSRWVLLLYDPTKRSTFDAICKILPAVTQAGAEPLLLANTFALKGGAGGQPRPRDVTVEEATLAARPHNARVLETDQLILAFQGALGNANNGGAKTGDRQGGGRRSSIALAGAQVRDLVGAKAMAPGQGAQGGPLVATMAVAHAGEAGLQCVEEYKDFREESAVTCLCFGREKEPRAPMLLAVASKVGSIVVFRARRTEAELRRLGLESEPGLTEEQKSNSKTLMFHSRMVGHTRAITSMFFTDGQDQLVSTSVDKSFRIWKVSTGEMLTLFTDSTPIDVAARLPTSQEVFVTANSKAILRLINSRNGAVLQKLKVENEVRAMAFDTAGTFLVLGTRVGTLHTLECTQDKAPDGSSTYEMAFKIQKFKLSRHGVTCISFVPAMKNQLARLLVNTSDSSVAILDCVYDGQNKLTNLSVRHRVKVMHTVLPLQSCHSPFGEGYLISGSEDNKVYIYSLSDYRLQHLRLHQAAVVAVAVNSQDTLLASADSNGIIALWRRSATAENMPTF